jgi:ubiquinone/menaquinone biosynthesis C-methylase UbiE|tara:strand:+ start:2083 stop:2814 length:732 start_codon:yes stop_codon:yes gene_type:complete
MNMTEMNMSLCGPAQQEIHSELTVMQRMLQLDNARVLELGCGAAEKTRQIAERTGVSAVVAAEVDAIQHEKNLSLSDLPKVTFKTYGAEQIREDDGSFDIVMMFKSLHHVSGEQMDTALQEMHRVLQEGGCAYISEPVYAGTFNEIMRLFHDEEAVRREAFDALARAVDSGLFEIEDEYFFKNVITLQSWEQYEHGILNVSHTDHQLSAEILAEVKARFLACRSHEGFVFEIPNRVDLLRKSS